MCDDLRIFEGPSTGRCPVFRSSNLSSGLLKLVGKMVGHCYLMDGQGFPFLSKACYYYLCDQVDKALVFLTLDDLSESVKGIVLAVSFVDSVHVTACLLIPGLVCLSCILTGYVLCWSCHFIPLYT